MKKYSAFIFDMDGTLVHNMHYHKEAWLQFLASKGHHLTEEEWYANNHGQIGEIVRRIFGNGYTDEEIFEIGEEKENLYRNIYQRDITPLEGLLEFLNKLKVKNYDSALATMGDRKNIDFTLKGIGLVNYFNVELAGQDVSRGKPHPDIFLQAAEDMKKKPEECLVFEDSFSGIEAARAAGMELVVLSTTHNRKELEHFNLDYIIDDYNDPFLNDLVEGF